MARGLTSDWTTWNTNATFPLDYARSAAAAHYVPVFSYYQLLQSARSCGGCGEQQRDLTNLNSPALMAAYYSDFTTLMKRLGVKTYGGVAGFGGTAIVQVEPDFSAYAEQAVLSGGQCFGFCTGSANDPAHLRAAVASSGDSDLAGYANTYSGFVEALTHIRDLYAPNVLLGYHVSNWATAADIGSDSSPTLDVTTLADEVVAFSRAAGAGRYNLVFNDVLDRDAGYYQSVYGNPHVWWDRDNVSFPNFHRWESYLATILAGLAKPGVVWQIPLGNQYYDTENNTLRGTTRTMRAEYLFAHPREVSGIGVVALLFGPGGGGQTGIRRCRQRRRRRQPSTVLHQLWLVPGPDLRQPRGPELGRRWRVLPGRRHGLLLPSRGAAVAPGAADVVGPPTAPHPERRPVAPFRRLHVGVRPPSRGQAAPILASGPVPLERMARY